MKTKSNIKSYCLLTVLIIISCFFCNAQEDPLISGKLRLMAAKESADKDSVNLALNQAIAYFNKELEVFQDSPEAYTGRGEAKLMLGDLRGAIADCRKATEIERENIRAYIIRGQAEAELGDYRSALREFDMAINLNPHHDNVNLTYFYRGNAKSDSGNDPAAIIDYSLSLEIIPFAPAYYRRGMAKMNLADRRGACADWSKAKELGMPEADTLLNKNCRQSTIPEPFR
ncbi:MAG: hypothetical protein JXR66_13260 [Bacteroidales bacterium]|nr:hypothetical protein [Bacteroidales bacterium]